MATSGNIKAKSFTMQGNGGTGIDVKMLVKDDTFRMEMGDEVLMSVAGDGNTVLEGEEEKALKIEELRRAEA